ncbi:WD40 repeat-like protein [Rhizopogon salebrosus TDB-379]|nr:WD40 repeat-like protein [Rhizopogon salebrosus TDB-379]
MLSKRQKDVVSLFYEMHAAEGSGRKYTLLCSPPNFLIHGEILRTSLWEWHAEKGDTLEVKYFESVIPPQRMSDIPHEVGHFVTASYDGHLRLFDYSQNPTTDTSVHQLTSVCVVPFSSSGTEFRVLASSSHDLTTAEGPSASTVASLHLYTGPLSCIFADASGSYLLTSSWDGLIGVWDTSIPDDHQQGHAARVSKALFATGLPGKGKAYSCGFDSMIRAWDIQSGVCVNAFNVPERLMLDLAETPDGNVLLAAPTDRTVSIFDLRVSSSSLSSSAGIMMHPATPSCIAPSGSGKQQVVTGAYDGVARLWDLQSTKGAVTSFRVWGGKKVCGGIGGEGGMEVWRIAGGT